MQEIKDKFSFKPKIKEKTWNPDIESTLFEKWQNEQLFKFDENSKKPLFSIDTPPPYVNTPVHIGQAYTYTWMDMFVRFKRMDGFNVLFPMGLDKNGLPVVIVPADTTYSRDLLTLIDRGDIDSMSFQWVNAVDEWDTTDPKNVIRTLIKAKELWDVSPVTFPAYPQTKAGVRMGLENKPELRSAKGMFKDYLEELLEFDSNH